VWLKGCGAFEIQACVLVSIAGTGLVKQGFKEDPSVLKKIKSVAWWATAGADPER